MSRETLLVQKLESLSIGLPDGTCLCDFCNRRLKDKEEVRVYYSKLNMSEREYKEMLRRVRRFFRVDRVIAPSTTEDINLCCTSCVGDKLEEPTYGTDEWIFKAVLTYKNGKPRLINVQALYHSPPEEGTV